MTCAQIITTAELKHFNKLKTAANAARKKARLKERASTGAQAKKHIETHDQLRMIQTKRLELALSSEKDSATQMAD